MFSYKDRLRAVQLYIKLGKRIGLTIRQLGYPTKNALRTWCSEYERRPRYSQADKHHEAPRVSRRPVGLSQTVAA